MTKLEEMAKAFREAERDCTGPRDWVIDQAMRAALKVLREPNMAMIRACDKGVTGSLGDMAEWYRNFWRAGIDALLAEGRSDHSPQDHRV